MPTCSRSSTRLPLPWPSSRGRLSARRSAPRWIPHSSHPLLLVGVLPLVLRWFAVDPPLRSPPLLLSPLSLPLAPSPWPVTPLPPLCPRPHLVPRVRHPQLLLRLVCRMQPPSRPSAAAVWPPLLLLPPLPCGCCPNALPPPFPPLRAVRLVPAVPRGYCLPLPLPLPRVPVDRQAGPLAGSTSLGIPPLSGPSPMPSLWHPLLLSITSPSLPTSLTRSPRATTALGTLLRQKTGTFICAAFISPSMPATHVLSRQVSL